MENFSIWERENYSYDCDVAIVGGGFTGCYTAYFLRQLDPKLSISIFEQSVLPSGASTRNAGFACFGSPSECLAVAKEHGKSKLEDMLVQRYQGLELMIQTLGHEAIGYMPDGGNEVFFNGEEDRYRRCQESLPWLNEICELRLGLSEVYRLQGAKNPLFQYSIYNAYEGSINPAMALTAIQGRCIDKNIVIHKGLSVHNLRNAANEVSFSVNNRLTCRAKKVIIATNGYTSDILPQVDVKPARNMVMVTKPLDTMPIDGCYHYDEGYIYFRNVGKRILLGGARNIDINQEYTSDRTPNKKIQNHLTQFLLNRLLPQSDSSIIDYLWTGTMGVGDGLEPISTWIDSSVLVGVRLNGMGVALSSSLGKQLAHKMYHKI